MNEQSDVFATAKFATLANAIKASSVPTPLTISSPKIRSAVYYSFELVNARLYYVQQYVRNHKPELAAASIARLSDVINENKKTIGTHMALIEALCAENGVPAPFPARVGQETYPVATPLAHRVLALIRLCDEYVSRVDTAWICGHVDDADHDKAVRQALECIHSVRRAADEEFKVLATAEGERK